jgi:hypothetical protein
VTIRAEFKVTPEEQEKLDLIIRRIKKIQSGSLSMNFSFPNDFASMLPATWASSLIRLGGVMTQGILLRSLVLLLALVSTPISSVLADGGKAKNAIYDGQARPQSGNGSVQFNIDTSPIIFYLGTVNNKYHVLLIRVKNNSDVPVNLAKDQDTIEMSFVGGQKVKGLLNLPATDRATWDGLETEMRTAVVYPAFVEAREEEGIYCYVPLGDVKEQRKRHEMPNLIAYNIKSLAAPVMLRQRVATAARNRLDDFKVR